VSPFRLRAGPVGYNRWTLRTSPWAMPSPGSRRVLAAVLLFSLNPVLYRKVSLDPLTILWSVNAIAALTLVAASAWRGRAAQIVALSSGIPAILLLAVCFTVNNALFLTALQRTTVANATLTHYLAPLFVAALAAPLLHEPLRGRALAAMSIACLGVLVMVAGSGLSLADAHFVGLVCGTGSAVFFALEIVQKKVLAPTAPADVIAARYLLLSLVLLAPFTHYSAVRDARIIDLAVLTGAGVITSAFGIYLFTSALRTVSAQHAAAISYLEPLGAVLWALLLIGEVPDRFGVAGGSLVLVGILMIVVTPPQPDVDATRTAAAKVLGSQ
jgi:drug/metabolite transporter (DMT)-like permease